MPNQAEKLRILTASSSGNNVLIPNSVAVVSGKGGTGKTFFAVNFAKHLSEMGKKVLLVDLDINFANVHLALNVEPERTMFDFFTQRDLFEEIIFRYNNNFHLIFGESGNFDYLPEVSDVKNLIKNIEKISAKYDVIIFDNSSGISEELFTAVRSVEYSFVVLNPEVTSVLDSYVILKAFKRKKIHNKMFVVVNKLNPDEKGESVYVNIRKAAEKFLKFSPEYLGAIPSDESVTEAFSALKPLENINPSSVAYSEIKNLAEKFLKETYKLDKKTG